MKAPRTRKPYEVVIDLAKTHNGQIVLSDPSIIAAFPHTAYRLPTYIWEACKRANLTVTRNRVGRQVVSYTFPALVTVTTVVPAETSEVRESADVEQAVETPELVEV